MACGEAAPRVGVEGPGSRVRGRGGSDSHQSGREAASRGSPAQAREHIRARRAIVWTIRIDFCRPSTCLQLGSSSAQEVVARSGRPFTSSAQQRGLADPGPTLDDKDAASPDDRLDRGELALTLQEVHGGTTVKTPKPSAHTYCTATPLRSRSRKGSIFGAGRRKDQGAHPVASTRTLT